MRYDIRILSPIVSEEDDNIDVNVILENGDAYFGTFFTVKNIDRIMTRHKQTGESANGSYFWSINMLIIDKINIECIKKCIDDLLKDKCFPDAFSYIGNRPEAKS
ncbi:MAG: hypothetical protein EOP56_14755 [Sphingobacteriales bacterium]|nr:MAG: hypothetical protein EOP56_14755 [Sphingobacteriales bacterium]